MLSNFVRVLWRNAWKNKVYTLINITGFSLGLACVILISLYVLSELSFDRFHSKANRIVRLNEIIGQNESRESSASVPFPVAPTLKEELPHLVTNAVRFFNMSAPSLTLQYQTKRFNERNVFFADPEVFQMFDFVLLKGQPADVLSKANSIVITESTAIRYFGSEDPIGKFIRFEDNRDLEVTGIAADVPANAHFHFNALISFQTLNTLLTPRQLQSWFWNPCYTYVLLKDGTPETFDAFKRSLVKFADTHFVDLKGDYLALLAQSLPDIHLQSQLDNELEPTSSLSFLYILSCIAVLILLIAVVNFVNLTTARSMQRAKEVGIRKVSGSTRQMLMYQFIAESFVLTILSFSVAILISWIALPYLNNFLGSHLSLSTLVNPTITGVTLLIIVIVGLLAGFYPAFLLSSFEPIRVLKGKFSSKKGVATFRRALIVFQLVISVALIVSAIVIDRQSAYVSSASLGFDRSHTIIIPIQRSALSAIQSYEDFKNELTRLPGVVNVTAMEEILGKAHNSGRYTPEGKEEMLLLRLFVRHDFTETFDIPVIAGRGFPREMNIGNSERLVLINESMVNYLGWESPEKALNRRMGEVRVNDSTFIPVKVSGVVKDFNFTSLHQEVKPLVIESPPSNDFINRFMIKYMAVKIRSERITATIESVQTIWNNRVNDRAFEFTFLDDSLTDMYKQEERLKTLTSVFSVIAISVACLGLFGLSVFTAEQRMKEISVRKVLGSSVKDILLLLATDFMKLVALSNLIAAPIIYFLMNQWLEGFSTRVAVAWWMFLAGFGMTGAMAFLTIGYQIAKVALVNPVIGLRSQE